jgi:hypothetical protein
MSLLAKDSTRTIPLAQYLGGQDRILTRWMVDCLAQSLDGHYLLWEMERESITPELRPCSTKNKTNYKTKIKRI